MARHASGLVRFDGISFSRCQPVGGISLEDRWISALAEDADHNLWIATEGSGLFRWKDGEVKQFTTANGLPSDDVHALLVDAQGAVDRHVRRFAEIAAEVHGSRQSRAIVIR